MAERLRDEGRGRMSQEQHMLGVRLQKRNFENGLLRKDAPASTSVWSKTRGGGPLKVAKPTVSLLLGI